MFDYTDFTYFELNFGPQHPAAHGVLRLILELDGEQVRFLDTEIGFLHRGTEKLSESLSAMQLLTFFDRFDYITMVQQEHVFCLGLEYLLDLVVPIRASYLRMIFLELTRILNHLFAITTQALDVGALTPFL